MGLREDIQTDISNAFDTDLEDAMKSITYRSIEVTGYTPDIGVPDRIVDTDDTRGVFTEYTAEEVDNETILPKDIRLLILQNELKSSIDPKVDDEVVEINNSGSVVNTYKIINISKDPINATYEMQIRTSSEEQ